MAFHTSGVDQLRTDLFLREQPQVDSTFPNLGDQTTLAGRTQVPPSAVAGAVHIILIGQSTNSNSLQGTMPGLVNASNIFNMSIGHQGACFMATNPLLTSDILLGNHAMFLADALVQNKLASKVLISNIICGGNYFSDWKPGGDVVGGVFAGIRTGELAYRIPLLFRCLENNGLLGLKTIIDHQGGEWDSDSVVTSQSVSASGINNIIAQFKYWNMLKTGNVYFEHLNTRITNPTANKNITRAAETSVVDGGLVRLGADIDTLGSSFRYDGTHLTVAGGQAQAALKLPLYQNFLLNG